MRALCSYCSLLVWFASLYCCLSGAGGCLAKEREALLEIRNSILNLDGFLPNSWVGEDCCKWKGVLCTSSSSPASHVIIIDSSYFTNPYYPGTWFPNATSFAQFTELRKLVLTYNKIGGWVNSEDLCSLTKLRSLDLRNNSLGDGSLPPCLLSNLTLLEELDLSINNLSRDSSRSLTGLCGLKSLYFLSLSSNNLDDQSLPPCLGNLSSLRSLHLSWNNLKHPFGIPSKEMIGVRSFPSLREVFLIDNTITDDDIGSIIPWFYNSTFLYDIRLSGNYLTKSSTLTRFCGLGPLAFLRLDDNNLEDQNLSPCLGNLSSLGTLSLSRNKLKNPFGIPSKKMTEVRPFDNLIELDLDGNSIADGNIGNIIPWLYNRTTFTSLDLGNNYFTKSSTLTWLCRLRTVTTVVLRNNSMEGCLHPCIRNMHSLVYLDLSHNHFMGSIPSFIFNNLTKLGSIDLSKNRLHGNVSFSMFANHSMLLDIDLSKNVKLEVETEYPHWIPTFQLRSLYLENCNLNLYSTRSIPTFISNQFFLEILYLGHNSLKGVIPSWLIYKSALRSLSLQVNSFEGSFPQPSNKTKISILEELDMSNNNLYGALPTNIGILLPEVSYMNLSENGFQDRVPLSLARMDFLKILDLSKNRLSGEITSFESLKYLDLSYNCFQGDMLPKDSNMVSLQVLIQSHNNFTGTIPSSLLSSPFLKILDLGDNSLSGPIPSWLFNLSDLVSLILKNNLLQSQIPRQLCKLSDLHLLDLSNNYLVGKIPSCLNNITSWKRKSVIQINQLVQWSKLKFGGDGDFVSIRVTTPFTTKGISYMLEGLPLTLMTGLDLSRNKLTGNIPSQIGDLQELYSLNLSHNLLTGPFPLSFKILVNIESLDLSYNLLVGHIPHEITGIHALGTFNVSFNNLSGKIPYEEQFSTFNESSYSGNPSLCGPPLRRNCSINTSSEVPTKKSEGSGILRKPIVFYSFIVMSYALGFWAVVGFLLLNKTWRHKFFRTMDAYQEACIMKIIELYFYFKDCIRS